MLSSPTQLGALSAVVMIAIGLMKILETIVNKYMGQKSSLLPEEQAALQRLYQMHTVTDVDGRPIWYVPKIVGESQIKIVEIQKDIMHSLQLLNQSQQSLARTLERLEDRLEG